MYCSRYFSHTIAQSNCKRILLSKKKLSSHVPIESPDCQEAAPSSSSGTSAVPLFIEQQCRCIRTTCPHRRSIPSCRNCNTQYHLLPCCFPRIIPNWRRRLGHQSTSHAIRRFFRGELRVAIAIGYTCTFVLPGKLYRYDICSITRYQQQQQ